MWVHADAHITQRMHQKEIQQQKLSYELVFMLNRIRHGAIHCHVPIDFKREKEDDRRRKT